MYASHAQETLAAATKAGHAICWLTYMSGTDAAAREALALAAAGRVQTRKIGMYPSITAPGATAPLDSGTRRHGMSPLVYIGKMQRDLREMKARRQGVKVAR